MNFICKLFPSFYCTGLTSNAATHMKYKYKKILAKAIGNIYGVLNKEDLLDCHMEKIASHFHDFKFH